MGDVHESRSSNLRPVVPHQPTTLTHKADNEIPMPTLTRHHGGTGSERTTSTFGSGSRVEVQCGTTVVSVIITIFWGERFDQDAPVSWRPRKTEKGIGKKATPATSGENRCTSWKNWEEEEEHPVHPGGAVHGRHWPNCGWRGEPGATGGLARPPGSLGARTIQWCSSHDQRRDRGEARPSIDPAFRPSRRRCSPCRASRKTACRRYRIALAGFGLRDHIVRASRRRVR